MRISGMSLLALRGWIIAAVFIGWNGLLLGGVALNGWRSRFDATSPWTARLCVIAATLGVAALCTAVLASSRIRDALLAPDRRSHYDPSPFFLVAAVTLILGLFTLLDIR